MVGPAILKVKDRKKIPATASRRAGETGKEILWEIREEFPVYSFVFGS
jgi:hypothetical protein